MDKLIMTVVGLDRPGLVQATAALVTQCGGNWLESRLCRLGGQFAGIIHLEISSENHPHLIEKLDTLKSVGLTVALFADTSSESQVKGKIAVLEIVGNDRPGIVHQITQILSEHAVNVEELQTEILSAPMAGGLIFQAKAKIYLPEACSVGVLRKKLELLASDLQVDISFAEKSS